MRSILQRKEDGNCFLCMILYGDYNRKQTTEHHIVYGRGKRNLSEKYGLKVYLCENHHQYGKEAVHNNKEMALLLKETAQIIFMKKYGKKLWMQVFEKNYIRPETEQWIQEKEKRKETEPGFQRIEGIQGMDW